MLRKFSLTLLLVMVSSLIAACGSPAATPPTAAPAAQATIAPVATVAPTEEATEAATEEATEAATEEATEAATEEATEAATEEATTEPTSGTSSLADLQAKADTISPELAAAFAGDYKGTTVTMAGPFVDEDAVKFNAA
ncbi:MAG: hypothetical protein HGA19_22815, partial [Oscillochloris sp.]|nr:hypothetical protein [Oscillochloris sp.]